MENNKAKSTGEVAQLERSPSGDILVSGGKVISLNFLQSYKRSYKNKNARKSFWSNNEKEDNETDFFQLYKENDLPFDYLSFLLINLQINI